jgi:PAS domain S-box-containing protein
VTITGERVAARIQDLGGRDVRQRVAVIDDSADVRDVLAEVLGDGGYEVVAFAGDGPVLADLVEARPDLVVLDLLLPGPEPETSGWDILRGIRAHPSLRAVPILICSGDIRALRTRAHDVEADPLTAQLEKPFSLDALEAAVAKLVDGRSAPSWDDERDLVLIADARSRLVDASPAALELLGLSREHVRRLGVADIVAHSRPWTDREWRRYLEQGRWQGPVLLRRQDGAEIPALAQAEIIRASAATWHISRLEVDGR